MFNQLTPGEVVTSIGTTLRSAARNEGEMSDFDRDQLMSAYSATRHLAVELASYAADRERFAQAVRAAVAEVDEPELRDLLAPLADRLDARHEPAELGATVCDALAVLRASDSPAATCVRDDLHAQLRILAEREVDLLADALG